MYDKYQLKINTEEHGAVNCIYKGEWSVVLDDDRVVLRRASAANVAGYLAAILGESEPDMIGGLERVLHSIEAMVPAEVPF